MGWRCKERSGTSPRSGAGRQFDDADEELVDLADDRDEPLEVDRLGDVGVGVQLIAAHDVLVGLRGGQYDDRDPAEVRVVLDLGEYLAAVAPGQVEVE